MTKVAEMFQNSNLETLELLANELFFPINEYLYNT